MKFSLFKKISFNVPQPIPLIEGYCFQTDFYSSFDLLKNRKIEDVNRIGARIGTEVLKRCKAVTQETQNLRIFQFDLDKFLDLPKNTRDNLVGEFSGLVLKKLVAIRGIGFSKTTKILHTLYPQIIPMIDNPLQYLYSTKVNKDWTEFDPAQILIDYYDNLVSGDNLVNINQLAEMLFENRVKGLTRIRIFDILWWSYLRAESLRRFHNIDWSTIRGV